MLTFFDYLRQRAFESVLTGAQEALELLESQKDRNEPPKHNSNLPSPRLTSQAGSPGNRPENNSPQENRSEDDDELLPAPRRRGRPGGKSKGKG